MKIYISGRVLQEGICEANLISASKDDVGSVTDDEITK